MDTPKKSGFAAVLRTHSFMKLWTGQIISYAGDRLTQMALLGWLITSSAKTGSEMTKITFFNLLPSFIFGQIAGIVADRISRKTIMVMSDFCRTALVFALAFLVIKGHATPELVYAVAFLSGVCSSFFYPAKLAIIPNLVKSEELQAANALCSGSGMIAILIGTSFGGILVDRLGVSSAFIITGATYFISTLAILWIHYDSKVFIQKQNESSAWARSYEDLKQGWSYLKNHRRARNLVLLSTFLSFLSSFFYLSLTVLAVDYFKVGIEGVGKLLTMLGVGMIAGAFLAVLLKKWFKLSSLIIGSFIVVFVTNISARAVNSYSMAWLWLIALGAANSIIMVTLDTLLQRIIPNRFNGKVFGFRSVMTNGVFLLSLLGAEKILAVTSPFALFRILALSSLAVAFLILVIERNFTYQLIRTLIRLFMRIFFFLEIEGKEHFSFQGKVILAGNHTGYLDGFTLVAASERPIRFLVAQSLFSWPFVGWFVRRADVIPIMEGKGTEAVSHAVETLKRDKIVGIFPEGRLSRDGSIGKFHRGLAKLHRESQAPIVPFVIHGGYEAWRWDSLFPKFHKIILQFGQPINNFHGTEMELLEEIKNRVQFMKEALERRERAKAEQVYIESVLSLMQMKSDVYGARTALALKEGIKWNEMSYAELSRQTKDLSDYLIEAGVKRSDRIAILSESRPEWAIAFFACVRTGAVFVPLDIKLTLSELFSILSNSEPRVLFVSSQFAETAKILKTLIPSLEFIFSLNQDATDAGLSYFRDHRANQEREGRERDFDETALIIYTSGTTGNPKGVATSFRNLIFEVRNFEEIMKLNAKDMFLSILPLSHLMELTGGFLGVLNTGGSICYSQSLHPQEISKIVKEKRISYMITVPLFLKMLKGSIEKEISRAGGLKQSFFRISFNISRWIPFNYVKKLLFSPIHKQFGGKLKGFISGGASLEVEIADFFYRIGIPAYQGYGLTETSPVITMNTPRFNKLGSVGRALPDVYVKILNKDNEEEGEIITKGPHVMKGYYKNEDLTNEVIDEGRWFHTGDLGKLDKDGFLYITGRIKNLIVLGGGKKVHPEEVEACFSKSALFKEVCVLGRKSKEGKKEGTEEVIAVIVPSDALKQKVIDQELLEREVENEASRVSQDLAIYKRPTKIFVHKDDLPKTATRKVKRSLVLDWLESKAEPSRSDVNQVASNGKN